MKEEFTRLVQMNPVLRHDPFVKSMLKKEERHAACRKIHGMNQYPFRSGWIVLLQNRINLDSVGNIRYKTKVYYDHQTKKIGLSADRCDTPFRCARLKNNQPAAGWMEV